MRYYYCYYYYFLLLFAIILTTSITVVDAQLFDFISSIQNTLQFISLALSTCMNFYSSYDSTTPTIYIIWDKLKQLPLLDIITFKYDINELNSICVASPGYVGMESGSYIVDRGTSTVTVHVKRSNGIDGDATIDYRTISDTAIPNIDYIESVGTVTLPALTTLGNIDIQLITTDLTQPTKQFKIAIDHPTNIALLAPRTATITIYADKSVLPNYNNFNDDSIDYIQFNGDATKQRIDNKQWWDYFDLFSTPQYGIRLTNTGSIFYEKAIPIDETISFRTSFKLKTTQGKSGSGLSFIVQADPNGVNAVGGDYGYSMLQNYVAVLFDMNNSIAIIANGIELTRTTTDNSLPFDITNTEFYVWVEYNNESTILAVYISQTEKKPRFVVLQSKVDIISEIGSMAYFGFTAGSEGTDSELYVLNYRLDNLIPPKNPPIKPNGNIKAIDIAKLYRPTAIDWLPNGLMLVTEKAGIVHVFDGTTKLDTPFYDVEDITNSAEDRGLLSLKVYPNFTEEKPYVYMAYTYEGRTSLENPNKPGSTGGYNGPGNRVGRLVRVEADISTGYRTAVPGSEYILVGKNSTLQYFNPNVDSTFDFDEPPAGQFPDGTYVRDIIIQDSSTHGVCGIAFSPDGNALYFGIGDGGSYNRIDPRNQRCIDVDSLSGKVLRIDPITGNGLPDNPFYNLTNDPGSNSAKVYQLGLRHPYTLSVDKSNGTLYIGEVGWETYEEINTGKPGANFGWPYYEGGDGGNQLVPGYAELDKGRKFLATNPDITPPFYALNHMTFNIGAIIVGAVLTSNYYGEYYRGDLFFNNLEGGVLYHAQFDENKNIADIGVFHEGVVYAADIVEGPDGILYYAVARGGEWRIGRWELVQ